MKSLRLIDGKLLTAEQSVRLAMIDSIDRQRMIEHIAAHLRAAGKRQGCMPVHATPRDWYSMRIGM